MVVENDDNVGRYAGYGLDSNHHHESVDDGAYYDVLKSPPTILGLACFVLVIVGGVIRFTRLKNVSSVDSQSVNIKFHQEEEKSSSFRRFFTVRAWIGNWRTYCCNIPNRIWSFYIDALIIPQYRKEWDPKYNTWSHRSPIRDPIPPLIKEDIRLKKREARRKAKAGPQPVTHDHSGCGRITFNIAGMRYETQIRTLQRYPETLLGNPSKLIQFYDPATREYYFDRNRHSFEAILYFYQSGGRLHRPEHVNSDVLLEDAYFYELSIDVIDQFKFDEGLTEAVHTDVVMPKFLLRRKIWLLFEYPESSGQAKNVAILSLSALFVSIGSFCIETLHSLELAPTLTVNSTGSIQLERVMWINIHDPFFLTETICVSWFLLEFTARILCCPVLIKFLMNPLNIIDAVALCPYFLTLQSSINDTDYESLSSAADSLYLLRIIRVVRVFRIFKLSKHLKGLKILGQTLKASMNEMFLLIFFIGLGVIFFSSMMYFAELEGSGDKTHFYSVAGGYWWAVITITTVGYGDTVPLSFWGKVVGTLCAIAGVLTIALPVPVIVANFNYFYQQVIDESDLRWRNVNHVASCPYRPQGFKPIHHFYLPSHVYHHDQSEANLATSGQQHLNDSIRNYVRTHKYQHKHHGNSSEEEFGVLMKGKKGVA